MFNSVAQFDCYKIDLKTYDGSPGKTVTIVAHRSAINEERNVFHISHETAIAIVYAAYKDKVYLILDNKPHYISNVKGVGHNIKKVRPEELAKAFIVKSFSIQKTVSNDCTTVEKLVYIENYDMLAPVVLYESDEYDYIMRIADYKEFARKFTHLKRGKVNFAAEYKDEGLTFAKKESLLYVFGYNVSKKDGYSYDYRQKILREILDLELMSKYEIIELLEFNKKAHPGDKYAMARIQWQQDIDYLRGKQRPKKECSIVKRK